MNFKNWLEEYDGKDFDFYKNLLVGKLNLDKSLGISQSLDALDPDFVVSSLNSLGEFKELPDFIQNQIIGMIKSQSGTFADLARLMSEKI
ncbi:MAG: hypothetical protein WCG45_06415 [bacterium]